MGISEVEFARLGWRVDALDRWRDRVDRKVSTIENTIDGMSTAQQIADEVAKKISHRNHVRLTFAQKLGGLAIAGVALTDMIRSFF